MRNFTALIFAALIGSLITLGAYKGMGFDKQQVIVPNSNVVPTVFTNNNTPIVGNRNTPAHSAPKAANARPVPVDFTVAAAKSTPAVVHIKSTVGYASNGQQRQGQGPNGMPPGEFYDYFKDLFGEDFFGDQGNPFGGQIPRGGQEQQSSGSGVIISQDGYIVTNNHVVENATELEVTLYDNRSFSAEIIGTDPSTDLAVIKVNQSNLPILELANSDDAKIGEWVLAVGNPFNLSSTVTAGIVSAKGRSIDILQDQYAIESFIQTDAAVNPGNSGGALVNVNGDLLGINTAIATRTGYYQGYSFAVPVNMVKKVVDDLVSYGSVQRAYLGVEIRNLDNDLARELNLNISQGVYVANLVQGGAAAEAGIDIGDVIVAVDGRMVKSAPELQEAIGQKRPGEVANVTVNRQGREKRITVPLRNIQGTTKMNAASTSDALADLGIRIEDLNPSERSRLDIDGGVRIAEIRPGVISQNTRMREGFIVTKVNEKPVRSGQDLTRMLKSKNGGIMVEGIYPGDPTVYFYAFGL